MTRFERVLTALDILSGHDGKRLEIQVLRDYDQWVIRFTAGDVRVQTPLETFVRQPTIVIDPFGEELIKRIK